MRFYIAAEYSPQYSYRNSCNQFLSLDMEVVSTFWYSSYYSTKQLCE